MSLKSMVYESMMLWTFHVQHTSDVSVEAVRYSEPHSFAGSMIIDFTESYFV